MQFLCRTVSFEGQHSYRMLQKKNYKLISTLKTKAIKISNHQNPFEFEARSRTFCKQITKLSKTFKHSNQVQFHQSLKYYRRNEIQNIIKRFKNIKSLSLDFLVPFGDRLVKDCVEWLILLKRLIKLWIVLGDNKNENFARRVTSPNMLQYFMDKLPRSNIQTLKFSFKAASEAELLLFKNYPLKLKNLIILHEPAEDSSHVPLASQIASPSFNMEYLRQLHLSALISIKQISFLLNSIEKPEHFKSLQLKPFMVETNTDDALILSECLSKFQNMNSLNLNLVYWKGDVANVFEALKTIHRLTELKMNFTLLKFHDLVKLIDAIDNLTSLKKLSLKVRSPKAAGEEITETCTNLFQKIGCLQELQKLRIFFRTDYMMTRECFNPDQLLSTLSKSLLNLENLKSFSFDFYNFIHSYQWADFFNKAKPTLLNLKCFKINFKGEKLVDQDLDSFLELLQNAHHLHELALNGFVFTLLQLFEKTALCLTRMKCLTRLTLNDVFGKLERRPMAKLLNELLPRPGFKEFKSDLSPKNQYIMNQPLHIRERVNLKDITNRNFSLKKASTPLDVFLGNNDVNYWKCLEF